MCRERDAELRVLPDPECRDEYQLARHHEILGVDGLVVPAERGDGREVVAAAALDELDTCAAGPPLHPELEVVFSSVRARDPYRPGRCGRIR